MPRPALSLAALAALLCLSASFAADADIDAGVLPKGDSGRPLNLDFETGTLADWTAVGAAFKLQPVKGDTVSPRRNDMKSRHQGDFWVGTYEKGGDKGKGTLTSAAFTVTHPFASFLVGGGPHRETCVEVVNDADKTVLHRAIGLEAEDMLREVVDLRPHKGKRIFVRVVDQHSGHWGHVNFDDFRFHTARPSFKARPVPAPLDKITYAGLPPKKAAEAMTVPPGFNVTLFAGEPDVAQPVAMCLDDRGRVWVAEAHTYPRRAKEGEGKDRIVIFEDTDGDGVHDKKTVFIEGLNLVSGMEVGFGGVWIGAAPYLMFIPMKDDKPAGEPKILLDGWGLEDTHETLNTFIWGPDGWLYGCHGVFTHSKVGKPGTAEKDRVKINAGVWRYHPTRHVFDVFAHGTSNPWGLDFNDHGHAFVEACVIPHNWHIIQGGRYARQAGSHFNPHTYDDIKTIAVHRHYVGANPHGGNGRSDSVGGGHAHCGTMIYLGGTWPEQYRGKMFMGNIHGCRINVDVLTSKGSGYVADRNPDFLLANDSYARFINLTYGPDGNVYLIDWYDKQACHHNNPAIWDRGNGRVYKVSYGKSAAKSVDLAKLPDDELVKLMLHKNDWYVRHARRLLQERGGNAAVHKALAEIAFGDADVTRRLRGLWALHVTGGLTVELVKKGLADKSEQVQAWTIQLATEKGEPSKELVANLGALASETRSPVVQLYLATAAHKIPYRERSMIVSNLGIHSSPDDHNLSLMLWYALESLVGKGEPIHTILPSIVSSHPVHRVFIARRIAASGDRDALETLLSSAGKTKTIIHRDFLRGLKDGYRGQSAVAAPKGWSDLAPKWLVSDDAEVRSLALSLSVTFGDKSAFAVLRKIVADPKADLAARRDAVASLLEAKDVELPPVLHGLLTSAELRGDAIRGLASFDDPKTPEKLLAVYPSLDSAGKRAVVNTLASRAAYGKALLDAVEAKKLPSSDLSADVVRQMRNLGDKAVAARIEKLWGVVRTTPADRLALIKSWKTRLATPKSIPDAALGRTVFNKTCAQCHTLFATGGKVGPEITGANRGSVDYLLENIFDPSAVIPKEYAMSVLETKRGRIISGIIKEENDSTLTVVNQNETAVLAKKDIATRETSNQSMMPEDILKNLSEHEIHSLFAYLRSPVQTPLLATAENAKDLFNGTDLTGWTGDKTLWRVEKGEIVGSTKTGLKRNEFLRSQMMAENFKLTLMVKLTPEKENSGVQFRSVELEGGEVKGPQADAGAGWWGKLYEEHGRGLLWKESGEKHVKPGEWNEYVIEAVGTKVKTYINGKLCVDLDDAKMSRRGVFAFQLHSGGPMEVRFKDVRLEVK